MFYQSYGIDRRLNQIHTHFAFMFFCSHVCTGLRRRGNCFTLLILPCHINQGRDFWKKRYPTTERRNNTGISITLGDYYIRFRESGRVRHYYMVKSPMPMPWLCHAHTSIKSPGSHRYKHRYTQTLHSLKLDMLAAFDSTFFPFAHLLQMRFLVSSFPPLPSHEFVDFHDKAHTHTHTFGKSVVVLKVE